MITQEQVRETIGAAAYDPNGDKIGTVGQVYLDDDTGRPEWLTVKTGLFGTKESFVPVQRAEVREAGAVTVPYDKNTIKNAPQVDPDGGHLSEQEESELYRYYDIGDRAVDGARDEHTPSGGAVGRDVSGPTTDDAMTRSEERMRVGTEQQESGRARLRKYVVTEQQQVTVPVRHEEARLVREPITEENRGAATDGPAISEEEHEVTLHSERPVVQTEAEPVERVRLEPETITEQETVSGEVRKEQIATEGADDRNR
ncbi:MAG TPA: PRC and DUF2382 domain-containing protein [Pseudonocardia sp.]|nr:PRC and DUF2382 domain-containing protein [Pseudonocardia sp.]